MLRNLCIIVLPLAALLAGCGGGGGGTNGDNPGDIPGVTVTISPQVAGVPAEETQQFTATVTGTSNIAVTWSVVEETDGGIVTQDGLYAAPMTPGTCHVRATSQADPTKSAVATVHVGESNGDEPGDGVTVTIIPEVEVLTFGGALQFAATVTGTPNTAVTWSVVEGPSGGTVTQTGLYTAPGVEGTYHVRATSQADPSESAVATVYVVNLPPVPQPPQ